VEALKQWRKQQAERENVRAFHVFSNRVLDMIARHKPRNEHELLSVPGIGEQKLKKYGEGVLAVCRGD
jgi:superfamily II DNA helicase RecQ